MAYRVQFTSAATRELKKLDRAVRNKIREDLEALCIDPRQFGVKKLVDRGNLYRFRVGPGKNYRVVYQIIDHELVILLLNVADRKDSYR